jgi:heat shock protein 5
MSEIVLDTDLNLYPFAMVSKENKPYVRIETKQGITDYAPEEISAMILKRY